MMSPFVAPISFMTGSAELILGSFSFPNPYFSNIFGICSSCTISCFGTNTCFCVFSNVNVVHAPKKGFFFMVLKFALGVGGFSFLGGDGLVILFLFIKL
jgi:hypothetical protein